MSIHDGGLYEETVGMPTTVAGRPSPVREGEVATVNSDGTIDVQPVTSRSTRSRVRVPVWYRPRRGDKVLMFRVDGHPQQPVAVPMSALGAPIAVTGSRASGAALMSLLAALVQLGWIVDNTTT